MSGYHGLDDRLGWGRGEAVPQTTVTIPAGEKLQFAAAYEGCRPSTEEEDIVFTVTFTENDVTGEPLTAEAKLTSVRLQLEAVYEAPERFGDRPLRGGACDTFAFFWYNTGR